jgi:hypothetical protein
VGSPTGACDPECMRVGWAVSSQQACLLLHTPYLNTCLPRLPSCPPTSTLPCPAPQMFVSDESFEQDTMQLDLGRPLWRQRASWDSGGWSHLSIAKRADGAWLAGGARGPCLQFHLHWTPQFPSASSISDDAHSAALPLPLMCLLQ